MLLEPLLEIHQRLAALRARPQGFLRSLSVWFAETKPSETRLVCAKTFPATAKRARDSSDSMVAGATGRRAGGRMGGSGWCECLIARNWRADSTAGPQVTLVVSGSFNGLGSGFIAGKFLSPSAAATQRDEESELEQRQHAGLRDRRKL